MDNLELAWPLLGPVHLEPAHYQLLGEQSEVQIEMPTVTMHDFLVVRVVIVRSVCGDSPPGRPARHFCSRMVRLGC